MSSPHALIIDDNVNNLKVLGQLLSLQGVTYTAVQDATKIRDYLQALDRVDLIFLDLEMPHMDGYEAFQMIEREVGDVVPIVACTVHTGEMNNARELGFHSFLAKPLSVDRFPYQLKRLLEGEPVWDPGTTLG